MIKAILKDKNQLKSFYYLLIRGGSVVSNYLFSIIILNFFSDKDYGNYIFGLSVFMLLSVFLKLGLDIHWVKIFSELKTNEIPSWVLKFEKKVLYIAILCCLIIISLIVIYNYPDTSNSLAIIIFLGSVPLNVGVLLNSGKLRGVSKISNFAFLNIAGRILLSLIVFLILYYCFFVRSSLMISISHGIAMILLYIISILWIKGQFKLKDSKLFQKEIPLNFLKYNKSLLFKSYITVFFLWGDRFFLSLSSNSYEVAKYDICLKIAMLIMIIVESLKSTYAPVFAKNRTSQSELNSYVRKATKTGLFFSVLIFCFILFFGKILLSFFGNDFVQSYQLLIIISSGYTIASFFGQGDNILEMCGYVQHYLKYYALIVVTSLGLGIVLSKFYGALGMGVCFALGNILIQVAASRIVKSKMQIKTSLF